MKSYDHIHPNFRFVLGFSDKERMLFAEQQRWLQYSAAAEIFERLEWMLQIPKRPKMPNLLIVGEPDNGKTTLVRRFYDLHGKNYVSEDSDPVKPVILVEAPPSADEKSLYCFLLEQFQTPFNRSETTSRLRDRTLGRFRACHTRMLIIDELHSLLAGTARKQREVMNTLKFLCNQLSIPIVGVGTREAVRVLHTDPQHVSRFRVMTLPLWKLNEEFQSLLSSFESVLPLKKPSNLQQADSARLLHAISGGNIGNLHQLLRECAKAAITSGDERIHKKLIQSTMKKNPWLRPTPIQARGA